MGQMNIKDEAVLAEAKELSALLGTSTTDAVRQAVHERLLRARRERDREARFEAIMAISRRASALVPPHLRTSDHSDLYDEDGLPK